MASPGRRRSPSRRPVATPQAFAGRGDAAASWSSEVPWQRSTLDPLLLKSPDRLLYELEEVQRQARLPLAPATQVPCGGFRVGRRRASAVNANWDSVSALVLCGGTVPPSLGLTPGVPEAARGSRPGTTSQLRTGQILVPSDDGANDGSRSWNAGARLEGILGAARSASAPTLAQPEAEASSAGPKTPRSLRRLLRRASAVEMTYPQLEPEPKPQPVQLEKRPTVVKHVIAPEENPPGWRRPVGESVMWKPQRKELERSMRILGSLHELRRAGKNVQQVAVSLPGNAGGVPAPAAVADATVQPAGGPGKAEGSAAGPAVAASPPTAAAFPHEDMPLMRATLMDLEDKSQALMHTAAILKEASSPLDELGGTRHASAVIALRTCAVVERKAQLLNSVEVRVASFESVDKHRENLVGEIASGAYTAPPELMGIDKFIKKLVHPDGEPVDANKSDFRAFVQSFGLPGRHKTIVKLVQLAAEATDFWAMTTLGRAKAGAGADEIRRLLAVVTGISGNTKHEAMEECNTILCDRMAEQVLAFAVDLQKKDEFAVSRSDVPQVESARKCAAEINEQIREAVGLGTPNKHPCLEQAKVIATTFEVEMKSRIAQKALVFAKLQQVRDDMNQKAAGPDGIPEVGPASHMADSIDDAIKKAIKEGAPADHQALKEAKDIGKALRDADGVRKRMKAREDRSKKA